MADQKPFSLAIQDPQWKVELPNGFKFPDGSSVRAYDPWELIEKLGKIAAPEDGGSFNFPAMREVFGFPSPEEADKSEPKTFSPSRNMLVAMSADLQLFIKNLDASKKLAGLPQK